MSPSLYTVGGPVGPKSIYIPRKADNDLLIACLAGEYCSILTARQMGKSSLMNRTIMALRERQVRALVIDLQPVATKSLDKIYKDIIGQLLRKLKMDLGFLESWDRSDVESLPQRFRNFLHDVVLAEIPDSIVVFMDEIERVKQLEPKDASDFFSALRGMYNERASLDEPSPFTRLTFVLIGLLRPEEIIQDVNLTPFNIGKRIDLVDFNMAETRQMVENLPNLGDNPRKIAQWIYDWTGGQPYLTAAVCDWLSRQPETITHEQQLEQAIEELSSQITSLHLAYIRDYVINRGNRIDLQLRIYGLILSGYRLVDAEDEEISILKIAGLVKKGGLGYLIVRNQIYGRYLGAEWVVKELNKLAAAQPDNFELALRHITLFKVEGEMPAQAAEAPDVPDWLKDFRPTPQQTIESNNEENSDIPLQDGLFTFEEDLEQPGDAGEDQETGFEGKTAWPFAGEALRWVARVFRWIFGQFRSKPSVFDVHIPQNWKPRDISRARWSTFLLQADVPFTYFELIGLCLVGVLLLSGLLAWLSILPFASAFLYGLLIFPVLGLFLFQRRKLRLDLTAAQFPDTLSMMVNSLRAGYSTMQAFEAAAKELPSPISDELRRVVQNMQLGVPMESALEMLLDRIPDRYLEYFVTAINIQREVGGNLAEILDTMAYTIRELQRLLSESRMYNILPFRVFFITTVIMQIIQWSLAPAYFSNLNALPFTNLYSGLIYLSLTLVLAVSAFSGHRIDEAVGSINNWQKVRNTANELFYGLIFLFIGWFFGIPDWVLIWLSILLLARLIYSLVYLVFLGLSIFLIAFVISLSLPASWLTGSTDSFGLVWGLIENVWTQAVGISDSLGFWLNHHWGGLSIFALAVLLLLQILQFVLKPWRNRDPDGLLNDNLSEFFERGDVVSVKDIELSLPLYKRLFGQPFRFVLDAIYRCSPEGILFSLGEKLQHAGLTRWKTWQFILLQVMFAFLGWMIVLTFHWDSDRLWLVRLGLPSLFFCYPILLLDAEILLRKERIKTQLADALDLMTICVEAGLGFLSAMSLVSEKHRGELALEFAVAVQEIKLGKTRRDALQDIALRTGNIPEIVSFSAAILQAEILGVSIAKTLRIQADQMRVKKLQDLQFVLLSMDTINRLAFFSIYGPIILIWLLLPVLDKLFALAGSG